MLLSCDKLFWLRKCHELPRWINGPAPRRRNLELGDQGPVDAMRHELLSSFDSTASLRQAQAAIVGNYESFGKTST